MPPVAPQTRSSSLQDSVRVDLRRRGVSRVIVLAAIAAMAIAGFVAYRGLAPDMDKALAEASRPVPEDRVKPRPFPEAGEFRTRLAIVRADKEGGGGASVSLAKSEGPQGVDKINGSDQSLIGRELFRQALLIAARDELGLTTHDEFLDGEPAPEGDVAGVQLASVVRPTGNSRAVLRRVDDEGKVAETLLSRDLSRYQEGENMLLVVTPDAEALSREEFPKALNGFGLKGGPRKVLNETPVSDTVEKLLTQLDFTEIYAALRELHASIRADGESPAKVGALARGYAQLGVLSEFHWHPAHRAFKARALLYAQRSVARAPGSPAALRTRAFVRALVGIPNAAIDDLDQAAKIAAADPKAPDAPPWLEAIAAFVRADLKALEAVDAPYDRFASLLRLLAVEFPARNELALRAAKEVVKIDPGCYRALDVISKNCGINILHMSTVAGPAYLSQSLPAKLKAMKGLPEAVKLPLDRMEKVLATAGGIPPWGEGQADVNAADPSHFLTDEVAAIDALADEAKSGRDVAEPSWGVLAHLIRETNFVHVWRRLDFMQRRWSVPVGGYWTAVRPLVERHRYRPFLERRADPGPQGQAAFAEFAKHADVADFEINQSELITEYIAQTGAVGHSIWSVVYYHNDEIVRDLSEGAWAGNQKQALHNAQRLFKLDPRSTHAMARLVQLDWESARGKVDGWRKTTGDSPILLQALAMKYTELKRYDDARWALAAYIRQTPDLWAYKTLADNYKAQGDLEKWRGTLKEYLEATTDERGLDHARIQVDLAEDLMRRKKWAEARPYADAAAETWAGWAIQCAARCAEALEDWEAAETWYRRASERYPETCHDQWYEFCKRTGHGDIAAARKSINLPDDGVEFQLDQLSLEDKGYYYWLKKDLPKARECFERDFAARHTLASAFSLAFVADEMADTAGRDAAIAAGCQLPKKSGPKSLRILEMIRGDLDPDGKTPLDLAEVDKIIESISEHNRPITEYYVGRYLHNRRKPDLASKYLQHCAESPDTPAWIRRLTTELWRPPSQAAAK